MPPRGPGTCRGRRRRSRRQRTPRRAAARVWSRVARSAGPRRHPTGPATRMGEGALVRLAITGRISGSVLDAGCGTGENALHLAGLGHAVLGVDFAAAAIERAVAKAADRRISVEFRVGNALDLAALGRTFDTIIDIGLFHTLEDGDRTRYAASL